MIQTSKDIKSAFTIFGMLSSKDEKKKWLTCLHRYVWAWKKHATLYALFATKDEQPILENARAATSFASKEVVKEVIILFSFTRTTQAKSSDNSHKQPAANNDAFTCRCPTCERLKATQWSPKMLIIQLKLTHLLALVKKIKTSLNLQK